jgi:uncharacterized integral membrane protein (TIGR00697 family)
MKEYAYSYRATIRSERLWGVLLSVYCACLIISNVLASKVFLLGPFTLPCAVIIFPVVYILNDMMAELYPLAKVRRGILIAFALNLLAVICYEVAIWLPGIGENVFAAALGSTVRVLFASFLAYLVGSNLNAWIMHVQHYRNGDSRLFVRCILSTIVGEFVDAVIFIGIVFFDAMPWQALLQMIVAQASFKILYEIIVFPATNAIIKDTKIYLAE